MSYYYLYLYFNIFDFIINCDLILFSVTLFILFFMGCTLIYDLKLLFILVKCTVYSTLLYLNNNNDIELFLLIGY